MVRTKDGGGTDVMVVGNSQVNCVVVSRVVERMGLKVRTERPENAASCLRDSQPAIVILDGGPENRDCDGLIEELRNSRTSNERALPAVIMLSPVNSASEGSHGSGVFDMVIAKPVTVDRLQPAIEALRARNGDFGGKTG